MNYVLVKKKSSKKCHVEQCRFYRDIPYDLQPNLDNEDTEREYCRFYIGYI